MKKILYSILILGSLFIVTACNDKDMVSGTKKLKEEYETLNVLKDKDGKSYIEVKIDDSIEVEYISDEKAVDILSSKTGVIIMGDAKDSKSRSAIETIFAALKEANIKKVYYLDVSSIRDEKVLDESGSVKVTKEGTKAYQDLLIRLYDYLDVYEGLNDISIKRIYPPLVVGVKDGKIIDVHTNTVTSHIESDQPLDKEQKEELKQIYVEIMEETK